MNLLQSLRAAWQAFCMARRGWRATWYHMPVDPRYGRCAGSISETRPTYPGWDGPTGWRLSVGGDTYPSVHATPMAVLIEETEGMAKVGESAARIRQQWSTR